MGEIIFIAAMTMLIISHANDREAAKVRSARPVHLSHWRRRYIRKQARRA